MSDPVYIVLFTGFLVALIFSFMGNRLANRLQKTGMIVLRSFSFLFVGFIGLFLLLKLLALLLGGSEHLTTSTSPNGKHTIDFYSFDAGAAGTFGVRGELDGLFGFKKLIYYGKHEDYANVKWTSNDTIEINGNLLNVEKGEMYGLILSD